MVEEKINQALEAEDQYRTAVEEAYDYIENFDLLETITNVGNDEVFTPRKTVTMMLDSLPDEVWHNPNYRWLNPASKNGVFEREIALRLDAGLASIIPDMETRRKHILQNMIFSIGQTKFTANVARRTLYYCSQANRQCDGIKAPDGHYVNGYAIGNGTWFDDPEGNIKTPRTDHEFVDAKGRKMHLMANDAVRKKCHCKYCGIAGDSKYADPTQREKYSYDFIHIYHLCLERELQKYFFGGDRSMKFDIIIGNPPYQLSDGGAQSSARPIYHLFIEQAMALNPKYISFIVPSRWMVGGKGLDEFRSKMISDTRIRILHDFTNAKDCFPNNEITGGVCYFLWDRDHEGKCEIHTHTSEGVRTDTRFLKEQDADIFIREGILIDILKKVSKNPAKTVESIVSARKPYGLEAETTLNPSKYGLPSFSDKPIPGGLRIFGLGEKGKRTFFYIPADYPIPKKSAAFNRWKLFIGEADGAAGQIGNPIPARIIGRPELGEPDVICTETFLEIGPFDTKEEAENFSKYMRTKFFRILVGIVKQTQHTTKKVYQFVPLQLLSSGSDIDWSQGIMQIDQQLYSKYDLSKNEIDYIESRIQEMY